MTKYYYALSKNEEFWGYESIQELLEGERIQCASSHIGNLVQFYRGEAVEIRAQDLMPDLGELLQEQAFNECGEAAERWQPNFEEFQNAVLELVGQNFGVLPCFKILNVTALFSAVHAIHPTDGYITEVSATINILMPDIP